MARKSKNPDDLGPVRCPFTVVIDSNESQENHHAYTFENIASNADTGHRPYEVTTVVRHLTNLGDYSADFDDLGPWEQPRIMVERKSKADLFGSVIKRDNLENRLERLDQECEFAVVVVESELSDLMAAPPTYYAEGGKQVEINLSFKSLYASIMSFQQRYQRVHWAFLPGRDAAELATFRYLYRFYENLRRHKTDRDRKRGNHTAYLEGIRARRKNAKPDSCPYPKEHRVGGLRSFWVLGYTDMGKVAACKDGDSLSTAEPLPAEGLLFREESTNG